MNTEEKNRFSVDNNSGGPRGIITPGPGFLSPRSCIYYELLARNDETQHVRRLYDNIIH